MSNNIVMAFSPWNIVGCLLKKPYKGGVMGIPGPPLATHLCLSTFIVNVSPSITR